MSTSRETAARILDALDPLPVRVHPMFGEYAVYLDDRNFGFIVDDRLMLKPVPEAEELTEHLARGRVHPESKLYPIVEEDELHESDWLFEVVQTIASTQPVKQRRNGKKR
ncbi:TfoX/Sxy family protein [uncultured Agrococcus sp.]|uniref:TfoX/Sxy family protein n=1 Tax=uncultured Agrococcus sp. TaxID=382258 RepID=UPI0025F67399|nr:TfoX/Sxy family protein [uncultured Agrococcus sp.]